MDSHRSRSYGISHPSPYIGTGSTTRHSTVGRNLQVLDGDHHAVTVPQAVDTIHTYNLKEYGLISENSHASNTEDVPLVYLGEETTGSVVFPEYHLHEFLYLKQILLSALCHWTTDHKPTSRPAHRRTSQFSRWIHDSNRKFQFQLQITIHRRGWLTRKMRTVFFTHLPPWPSSNS
ncbi:hypothetical protein BJY52DRAFT_101044 [Lactarius psammicola]|nr:hypothetical protein BJY52DRAFT_101044 [Lactarius psammicola]